MLILCHTHPLFSSHVRLLLVFQTPQVLPCLEFSVCIVFPSAWNFPASKFFLWIINTHAMSLSLNITFVGKPSNGPQPPAGLLRVLGLQYHLYFSHNSQHNLNYVLLPISPTRL